jgi:4a-hydroxytetrahydrobiopterin dehydratase
MWQEKENSLYKSFQFKDFNEAFGFMRRVAEIAEELNHHPKWANEWNKVEIWLSTHSEGKVTEKDRSLAAKIDETQKGF